MHSRASGQHRLHILCGQQRTRCKIAGEIEPRWPEIAHQNAAHIYHQSGLFVSPMSVAQHNARQPWDFQADHIIFSPPYGNEAATSKNTKNWALPSRLQRIDVLRKEQGVILSSRWEAFLKQPTPGATGGYIFHYGSHPEQIGHLRTSRYWQAMEEIYSHSHTALRVGGYLILIGARSR